MPDPSGDDAPPRIVTCQGVPGAFSYEACGQAEPELHASPCASCEEALVAVRERRADPTSSPSVSIRPIRTRP